MHRLAPVLLLVACGGGGAFNSSVPANKSLSELDEDEACTLAEEIFEYQTGTFQNDLCTLIGQGAGIAADAIGQDYRAACEAEVDACLADFTVDEEFECTGSMGLECDATVGDLEACYGDTADLFADLTRGGCAPLTLEEYTARAAEFEQIPASCTALEESCDTLF